MQDEMGGRGSHLRLPGPPSPPLCKTGQTSSEGQNPLCGPPRPKTALRRPGWPPRWQPLLFDLGPGSQNSCKPHGSADNIP